MFSKTERDTLRETLVSAARNDKRITGAALTGSASLGAEDRWSDIDLAFGVAAGADRSEVIDEWTARMYKHGAVHHTDVVRGAALFRVFLLDNTLQVDLAFWPESEFGPIAPTFRLLFGKAKERERPAAESFDGLVGMGWLYALHVRSSIARGRVWQAEYMISAMRDQVLALACLRHGLPTVHGRGIDQLPADVTESLTAALVQSLDPPELRRAFSVGCNALLAEIGSVDSDLASRLEPPLSELANYGVEADSRL